MRRSVRDDGHKVSLWRPLVAQRATVEVLFTRVVRDFNVFFCFVLSNIR